MRARTLLPLPQCTSGPSKAIGAATRAYRFSLAQHSGSRQTSSSPLTGALGHGGGRGRQEALGCWGPGVPTPLPRGALSIPCRTAPGRGSRAGGRAALGDIGREAAPGRCLCTWTAYFPRLLLCVNGPHPPRALPSSPAPSSKKTAGHRGGVSGGVFSPPGTRPEAPGRPLGAAQQRLCSPRGTRGGRGAAPGASAGGRGREQRRRRGPTGAPSPPLPSLRPRGLRRREQRDRAGEGAPRVPGRTKRAAPAQSPRGGEAREEGAGAGPAERTHLSVGLRGGSARSLLGGHVAPGSLGALAAHDGGLLRGARSRPGLAPQGIVWRGGPGGRRGGAGAQGGGVSGG